MRPFRRGRKVMTRGDLRRSLHNLRRRVHEMNSSQTTTTDWWPRQSKHLVLTALGALDEAIEDAMHIARCAAEEKRQKRLEAEYTHAAQHKRVNESLQIFRESYRRNALP